MKVFKKAGFVACMSGLYVIVLLVIILGSPFWAWLVLTDDSEHAFAREW